MISLKRIRNSNNLIAVHSPKAYGTSVVAALQQFIGELLEIDKSNDPANALAQRVLDPHAYFTRKRSLGTKFCALMATSTLAYMICMTSPCLLCYDTPLTT